MAYLIILAKKLYDIFLFVLVKLGGLEIDSKLFDIISDIDAHLNK